MATLTNQQITDKVNAGEIVLIDCNGRPVLIDQLADIPSVLADCGFVEKVFSDYTISGTPTNNQVPSWNSTTSKLQWSTPSSGGGAWGTITGTLSSQTDLQSALSGKANTSDNLSVFAATTSLQLKTLISDETGSESLVFRLAPTLKNIVVNQNQNNDDMILATRATDSSPTGTFINYRNAAAGSLFKVNIDGSTTITSNSGTIFAAGRQGTTNPAISVISSGGTDATGLSITGAAAGSGVTIAVTSSGSNEDWFNKAKGTGIFRLIPDTAGAGTLVIGASGDTSNAQLNVYSQFATRPSLKLRAVNGTLAGQNVFESYNAAGTLMTSLTAAGDLTIGNILTIVGGYSGTQALLGKTAGGAGIVAPNSGLFVGNNRAFGWVSTEAATPDLTLWRDAAATLAQRDGTNAQTNRVYGTYTDTSNYVRGSIAATSTTVTIAAETAGTGADDIPVIINSAGTSGVGINITPTSKFHVGGSFAAKVVTSSAASLNLDAAGTIYVFTGSSATTWSLPAIAGITDRTYVIKNRGSATITLDPNSTEQLYSTSAVNTFDVLAGESVWITNDGTFWIIY